ncbi:MAG: Acetyltransferase, GNAT family [uncultured Thermomicrobiales bacterium]|uniref:Acetyltransferase, GNAT family n=1 Tax=uncultured Thermomicrobiales bacterium TaxID=1645740 RepID=A0A6J4TU98_9BACT|nr:MAG: Acetyltransferase, GNAT family [uncultured Thermomicrobiales bacterium]
MSEDTGPILNIVGESVALGPVRRDLIPTYQRWVNDLGTLRTLAMPPTPMILERETAWFEGVIAQDDLAMFTVYERATGRPIGNTELREIDFRNGTAGFGLMIGEPDARGKGYGTETTRLMLDYAFTALGLHNVLLTVYEHNPAAHRVYRKAGFREIGRRREARVSAGRRWDEIYMDCLATGFTSPLLARVFASDGDRSRGEP